jgi:hypothetical protein
MPLLQMPQVQSRPPAGWLYKRYKEDFRSRIPVSYRIQKNFSIVCIPAHVVGFLLIRRYNEYLMAVLMAILLSVFAAAGIWNNTLFGSAVSLLPG